jgi:ATP-dependent helicase/nuclease subunit B
MPDASSALREIAQQRATDPLAPVTVLAPSHAAALQMRRRLAREGPFAAVRFETLPRIAEILGAGALAAAGRRPLARPIGDYVAEQVARESRGALEDIRDLPGYARALRQIFRRLRRAGIVTGDEPAARPTGHFAEIIRLYRRYRQDTAAFYDEEDLLDAAADAVTTGKAGALADFGALYIVPPGPLTDSGLKLLEALRSAAPESHEIEPHQPVAETSIIVAPDPASEVREVVRNVISALQDGASIDEIAVFHGSGGDYGRLLREAFAAAEVPCVPIPGIPLIETRAGRGVLSFARLPAQEFARTAVIDVLTVAPLKRSLPSATGHVPAMTAPWDRVSREAGISKGAEQWQQRLAAYITDTEKAAAQHREHDEQTRAEAAERHVEQARTLLAGISELTRRFEPLRQARRAGDFIAAFSTLVADYFDPDAKSLEDVRHEVEQLGTVDAVGGDFSLETFTHALDANLSTAVHRPHSLGDGVLVADYRQAAGLQFQHVVLCGAFEGALPAGPGVDAIISDSAWLALKDQFPHIEDAATRIERAREAAERAVASASDTLTWTCPRFEPGGTREYYPSHVMVGAAQAQAEANAKRITATRLRADPTLAGVRSVVSPMRGALHGPPLDSSEDALRRAVKLRQASAMIDSSHPRWRAVTMLRSRRSGNFTEWDGNLSALKDDAWLDLQSAVSPTSLENYSVCGYRYFARSLLRLNTVEEPEEREMMDPATRGGLIHDVLELFFRKQKDRGRPKPHEAWTDDDRAMLMAVLDEALASARERGLTGLDIYAQHEARTIRADLGLFLEEDSALRDHTGGVPSEFETPIPEAEVGGVTLRGRVDRIDRSPDGSQAWVIDYKTGSLGDEYRKITTDDPLAGGTKLQLPAYLSAVAGVPHAQALYWFITRRGDYDTVPYSPSPENDERFRRTLRAIVAGIRSGAFPAIPGEENEFYGSFQNCGFCDFDRICSRRRDYEQAAKADHDAIGPWANVVAVATRDLDS